MMKQHWVSRIFAGVVALQLGVGLLAYADDTDWDIPSENTAAPMYQPYQPPPSYGQGYQPYPMPMQQVPVQQPPQSFLGKLLSPIVGPLFKRMSPPINQAPPAPKGEPRETVALKDPLIRLGRTIEYDGQRVAPGFYLLSVQPGSGPDGAMLAIKRQQQQLMQVPALVSDTMANAPSSSMEPGLPAPPNKTAKKEDKPKEPDASGLVELSTDGQTLLLVYQQGSKKYVSRPIAVTP